jgi:hypothetical protein
MVKSLYRIWNLGGPCCDNDPDHGGRWRLREAKVSGKIVERNFMVVLISMSPHGVGEMRARGTQRPGIGAFPELRLHRGHDLPVIPQDN